MNLHRTLPLALMLGCPQDLDERDLDGGDVELTTEERDAQIEEELLTEMMRTFGDCDAVFEARPTILARCEPYVEMRGHQVVKERPGFLDSNYHIGKWNFCEYQDGRHLDEAYVQGFCKDFLEGDKWKNFIPSGATSHLELEKALREEPQHYSGGSIR